MFIYTTRNTFIMALELALPISTSLAATYLINTLLAFAAVVLSDRIIAHEVELKHALIISVIALFVTPMLAPYIGVFDRGLAIVLSFVVWVIAGEILLRADYATKFKVLAIAFFVYYILSVFLADTIQRYLRAYLPL